MIRVVIDTNVDVSAILSDESLPAAILDLAANRKIQMFVTEPILAEYERVFSYPHLKIDPAEASAALALIRKTSKIVTPRRTLSISRDAHDNCFYECAEAAKARYLITGNTKHFPRDHKFTKIVTPREVMTQIGLSLAETPKNHVQNLRSKPPLASTIQLLALVEHRTREGAARLAIRLGTNRQLRCKQYQPRAPMQ